MVTNRLPFGLEILRPKWGWILVLGILMVILGTIALYMIPAASLATALVFGWLLLVSGVIEVIHAFGVRGWGGFFLHLACGCLGIFIGFLGVTFSFAGGMAV